MRRLKWLLFGQLFWLLMVFALGSWWIQLVLDRESKVVSLRKQLGATDEIAEVHLNKTRRMLLWESGTYFFLLSLGTLSLVFLYYRDLKRTRSIQAFFASLTHELKTPLASIRLQADAISSLLSKTDQNQELLSRLLEDASRLEGQVSQVLELARVEGGGTIHPRAMRIMPVLNRFLSSWIESNSSRAKISCDMQDAVVLADVAALQIVMRNLVSNSLRHATSDPVEIKITGTVQDSNYHLQFSDNGTENASPTRLGELFVKGEKSQGAGVGLYLVKSLVDQMGGRVEFKREHGFPVSITLPIGAQDA